MVFLSSESFAGDRRGDALGWLGIRVWVDSGPIRPAQTLRETDTNIRLTGVLRVDIMAMLINLAMIITMAVVML
jgi:hypothetical protein